MNHGGAMGKFCLALCLILTLSLKTLGEPSNTLWNETNIDKLKADLLKGYDKLNRPENFQTATKCDLGLTVIHMDLDEKNGVLETHAWLRLNWTDSKLKWVPETYENISQVNVAADEVWTPDISIYNSAEPNIVDHFVKTNKILYPNGMVLWVPTSKFKTYCTVDLKFWPFDEQKCEIKIGSWTFSALQLDLNAANDPIETKYFNSIEWELVSFNAERHSKIYDCCPEPYLDVSFYFTLRRRETIFKAVAIIPALVVVFMTLSSFWLPPQAGEKLLLNGVACILVCILLIYLSKLLPTVASTTPLIVTFYSHSLYLLSASFVISIIVINLSRKSGSYAVPKSLKENLLDGFIGKCLSASSNSNESIKEAQIEKALDEIKMNDDHQVVQTPTTVPNVGGGSKPNQNEWIRLAIIIDRVAFIIYVIIFILMGFIHFI